MNKKYVPDSLSEKDKKKKIKYIEEGKDRPKVDYKTKRSKHVIAFEKKYNTVITDDEFISKNIISKEGIKQILAKGVAAYYSSGSRPNVSAAQWSRARLASVIMNGKARQVDKKIWNNFKKN